MKSPVGASADAFRAFFAMRPGRTGSGAGSGASAAASSASATWRCSASDVADETPPLKRGPPAGGAGGSSSASSSASSFSSS